MSSARNCPACGGVLGSNPAAAAAALDGQTWHYQSCPGCGLLEIEAPPEQAARAYNSAYYGAGAAKFPFPLENMRRFAYRRLARSVHRALDGRGGRVLDIGCGGGGFLAALAPLGYEIYGTELPGPAYDRAAQVPGIRLLKGVRTDSMAEAGFDAVTLWHVLEHLPDPQETLETIQAVLKPGGLLFVEVPNLASRQARLFGERWLHLDPPRHLHQFTPEALRRLLARTGFEIVRRSTWSLQMGAFGWLQGFLNTHIQPPNLFYQMLLTRGRCPGTALAKAWSIALAALSAPLAGALTLLEAGLGQGAVIRCVCRKVGTKQSRRPA